MKKIIVAMAAASAMLGVSAAQAESSHVFFKGQVTDSTCEINAESKDQTVQLPTVIASALAADGQTAGTREFTIGMSKCPGNQKLAIRFEPGATVDTKTGWLKNSLNDGAKNVAIELLNENALPIRVTGHQAEDQYAAKADENGNYTQRYFARYHATGKAEAGAVASSVAYSVIYQ